MYIVNNIDIRTYPYDPLDDSMVTISDACRMLGLLENSFVALCKRNGIRVSHHDGKKMVRVKKYPLRRIKMLYLRRVYFIKVTRTGGYSNSREIIKGSPFEHMEFKSKIPFSRFMIMALRIGA